MQPEKESLQKLINKYIDGRCNPEEEQMLLKWMASYNSESEVIVSENTGILLKRQIDKANGRGQEVRIVRWFNPDWYAAASIILIAGFLSVWYLPEYLHPNKENTQQHISSLSTSPHFKRVINNSTSTSIIKLQDGSIVNLQKGSELVWQVPFVNGNRKVELHGKAFFNVAKDKHKPFIVFSGNISTTALGTSFWVDETGGTDQIQVKLITGKVMIKYHSGKSESPLAYLNPGQQLTYHITTKKAMVDHIKEVIKGGRNIDKDKIYASSSPQLLFNDTPLNEALDRLQSFYHVKIEYKSEEIQFMSFYGEFSEKDKVQSILNNIASANELSLKKVNNIFIISK